MNCEEVKGVLSKINDVLEEKKLYLTELDAAIGDGDHGLNMSKGFKALVKKLTDITEEDLGEIFKVAGMALLSNVGGAAGPLYGTALLKSATVINKKSSMDINDFINILEISLDGIKMRGKSKEGEKTMIDALAPAVRSGRKAIQENKNEKEVLNAIAEGARKGMEETKSIIATKGRASYLGERSLGHQDPGATSIYLILNTIAENI